MLLIPSGDQIILDSVRKKERKRFYMAFIWCILLKAVTDLLHTSLFVIWCAYSPPQRSFLMRQWPCLLLLQQWLLPATLFSLTSLLSVPCLLPYFPHLRRPLRLLSTSLVSWGHHRLWSVRVRGCGGGRESGVCV